MQHSSQQQQYHAGPYTITGFWTTRGASGVWGDGTIKGRKDNTWNGNGDCGASIVSGGGGDGGCGGGVSQVELLKDANRDSQETSAAAVVAAVVENGST